MQGNNIEARKDRVLMEGLTKAKIVIQRLTYYACSAGMLALLPMMLLTAVAVTGRSFLGFPIPGAVELSSYMLSVVILLGIAYTQQEKGHPRVTLLVSKFPDKVQALLEAIMYLLSIIVAAVIVWVSWQAAFAYGGITSDVLRIAQFPFRLLVPVSIFLLLLELIVDFCTAIARLFPGKYQKQPGKEGIT